MYSVAMGALNDTHDYSHIDDNFLNRFTRSKLLNNFTSSQYRKN